MNQNFDFIESGKYDVGQVRNFLLDEVKNINRKEHSNAFHLVYAILCAISIFLGVVGDLMSLGFGVSFIFQLFSPAMCVFTFVYSSTPLKLFTVLSPLAVSSIAVLTSLGSITPLSLSQYILTYIQILIVALVFTKTLISGYNKTTCFVLAAVSYGFIILCQLSMIVFSYYGQFSPSLIVTFIDEYFKETVAGVLSSFDELYSAEQLQMMLGYTKETAKETMLLDIERTLSATLSSIKIFLPSILAVSCMVYSFISVGFFSVFAKRLHLNIFVCIMDNHWTYRLSILSVRIYDILFFVFILSMFINLSASTSATIINLFIILTPLMFWAGVKAIFGFFKEKTKSTTASVFITIGICFGASLILGTMSAFLISSIGSAFLISRNRAEKYIMPIKIAQDKASLEQILSYNNRAEN